MSCWIRSLNPNFFSASVHSSQVVVVGVVSAVVGVVSVADSLESVEFTSSRSPRPWFMIYTTPPAATARRVKEGEKERERGGEGSESVFTHLPVNISHTRTLPSSEPAPHNINCSVKVFEQFRVL
jgi:hypothetical protein